MSSQLIEIPATKQFMQSRSENGLAEQYPDFKVRQQEYCKEVARAIIDDIKDRRSDDALPHDEWPRRWSAGRGVSGTKFENRHDPVHTDAVSGTKHALAPLS